MFSPTINPPTSSLGLKYHELRDHKLKTSTLWLKARQDNEGAENLWRIHDKLYDLQTFINSHPGGKDWIKLTKGVDITEAFESHHILSKEISETILPKYYVKDATTPRYYPFTFHKDDFYCILKERIRNELKNVPNFVKSRSKFYADLLFFTYVITAILAVKWGYLVGLISGVCLSMAAITAHNFFHQKDNFRMYYFDFTLMSSKEWRVSHALSHHLYTNTIQDMECSSVEPWFQYLPVEKNLFFRFISWLYWPIVYSLVFLGFHVRSIIDTIMFNKKLEWTILLPFTIPILMILFNGKLLSSLLMFAWIITIASVHFTAVGVNAGHHHPDCFHDGDAPRTKDEMDWGIFQLDAVMDRKDITGSPFLVLTNFGDHALHHLFPTLDHGVLEYLYPIFLETCKEFNIKWNLSTQFDAIKGQFLQLAKIKGKKKSKSRIKREEK